MCFLLQLDPKRCESCYGAETPEKRCCNTCEDVRESYRKKGWALSDVDDIKQVLMDSFFLTCKITHGYYLVLSCDRLIDHDITLGFTCKPGFDKLVGVQNLGLEYLKMISSQFCAVSVLNVCEPHTKECKSMLFVKKYVPYL